MGHSNIQRKTTFYVKWNDREDRHSWDNGYHKLPFNTMITVGGEGQWHNGWNGAVKNVNFRWGPGAFRTENFDDMQETPLEFDAAENEVEVDDNWDRPAGTISSNENY